MIGSVSAALLRIRKRISIWVLGFVLLALVVLLDYLLIYVIARNPPAGRGGTGPSAEQLAALTAALQPHSFVPYILSVLNQWGSAIGVILGVLVYGSDYGWGTLKTVFSQGPGRLTTHAGTLVALLVAVIVLTLTGFLAGMLCSALIGAIDGNGQAFAAPATLAEAYLAVLLIWVMWVSFGVALAILFRQSALAIGIGLIYAIVVEGLILGLLGNFEAFKPIIKAFPGTNTAALSEVFGRPLGSTARAGAALVGGWQAAAVVGAYTLAFLVVGAVLLRRRDVT